MKRADLGGGAAEGVQVKGRRQSLKIKENKAQVAESWKP